jgi:RNA polymerase sigma-70 factor (ECF subfamily)
MPDSPSFDRLLSEMNKGATDEVGVMIVRRFASRLVALAAARLKNRLRQRIDAEDVVQSVFKSFFRHLDQGELQLLDWDSLWGLLAQAVIWKVGHQHARSRAAKRALDKEMPSNDETAFLALDPTPEAVVIAEEMMDLVLSRLREEHREIFRLSLAGWKHAEIADERGVSIATVGRVLRHARDELKAIIDVHDQCP